MEAKDGFLVKGEALVAMEDCDECAKGVTRPVFGTNRVVAELVESSDCAESVLVCERK